MKGMRKRYIVMSLIFTFLYFFFRSTGVPWVENFELVTLNLRMNLRGEVAHSDMVKIVAIDDRSLSGLYYSEDNPWPWKRDVYARLIDKLGEAGVKSIITDISYDTYNSNDKAGDLHFAESLFMHPYVTIGAYLINNREEYQALAPKARQRLAENLDYLRFAYKFINPDTYTLPSFYSPYKLVLPENLFMNSAWGYGSYEIGLPGEDGMYHTVPLVINETFLADEGSGSLVLLPNIDILGLAAYYGVEPGDYVLDLKKNQIRLGDQCVIPVDVNGYFTINYYGRKSFEEISVVDVLEKDAVELESTFKDKIALIGFTAKSKGLFDLRPTPFNKNEAGVQIHATLMQNILDQNYLKRAPYLLNLALILVLFLVSSFILQISKLRVSIVLDLILIGVFNVVNYGLFLHNIWIDLFYPNLILVTFLLYNTITRVYQENRERLQTRSYFAKYVPAPVVDAILRDPSRIRLGGEKMEITVLFSDIIGFTPISEALEPEELVRLLNEYFTEMTAIIKDKYGGTLDKFVGDAIVAIFGAPFPGTDDPTRAVKAAIAMRDKALELQAKWQERGEKVVFRLGIGINTGSAVVGNIGSPDRINYTCIGDSVNVAARLESATRATQSTVLISASTYACVQEDFQCIEISGLQVKGKRDAMTVYSVLGQRESGCEVLKEAAPALIIEHGDEAPSLLHKPDEDLAEVHKMKDTH